MVTSKTTIEKIREIIEKHYARLSISVLGNSVFSQKQLQELEAQGIDTSNKTSLITLIYNHNFINNPIDKDSPTSIGDMKNQQSVKGLVPEGEAHDYTTESINEQVKQYIDKLRLEVQTRVEGIIRANNDRYKMNALQNLDRPELSDRLVKESSLGKVKQELRDTFKQGQRDWQRVALTEMSNAIGMGSVDRIVSNNVSKDLDDVYVFRIPVNDAITCKYCRRFYNYDDMSPKVYKLSTLLGNGSNYGRKTDEWLPVVGATHPNTRTSQIIELKPGFKALPGGKVTYIGLDKWKDYIHEKLEA